MENRLRKRLGTQGQWRWTPGKEGWGRMSHPKMPNAERAKQFMPFAALRGFEEAVAREELLEHRGGGAGP